MHKPAFLMAGHNAAPFCAFFYAGIAFMLRMLPGSLPQPSRIATAAMNGTPGRRDRRAIRNPVDTGAARI